MKSKILKRRRILECSCGMPNHLLIFDYDEEFKYVSISFEYKKDIPFFKRIRLAFNYLFRKEELCYNDIIIHTEHIDQLDELVQEIKKRSKEK